MTPNQTLPLVADTGGGYASNWPASYGYGKVISHPFKEEVIQARPAFVSVANNVRALGGGGREGRGWVAQQRKGEVGNGWGSSHPWHWWAAAAAHQTRATCA